MQTWTAQDYRVSKSVVIGKMTIVIIAVALDEDQYLKSPDWTPSRESAFGLDKLVNEFFDGHVRELQEGVFESDWPTEEIDKRLQENGFGYAAPLDQILKDFIDDMGEDILDWQQP